MLLTRRKADDLKTTVGQSPWLSMTLTKNFSRVQQCSIVLSPITDFKMKKTQLLHLHRFHFQHRKEIENLYYLILGLGKNLHA